MDEPACPGCRDLLQRVAELEARVTELTRKLDDAVRAGKRQAAPFRKGPPKPNPKTPGRKSGDAHGVHGHRPPPPPEQIAECHEARLPDACPHCQGHLVETGTAEQFQTEIPRRPFVRKFRVHIGHCDACGKRTQGRHPLQTSDALGAAASQIGPDAQAAAGVLHTQAGLSHGKVAAVFDALFGIDLTRGASAQINLRAATRLEPDYRLILGEVRASEQIAADETGWRVGGHPAWLHAWVGDRATAYAIDSQRSAAVLERVIGVDWPGVLTHDGLASYGRFTEAIHQQCVAHVLRRARDLLATATRGAVRFPRQVIRLFTEAIHWRNAAPSGELTGNQLERLREAFGDRLLELVCRPRAVPEYATLARHLWDHFEQWFAFVFDPRIEPTNWKAEQAIRPAVVNRKVWGGNRTAAGAKAQGVLMSVLETCRRHAHSAVDHVSQTLRWFGNRLLPGPLLFGPQTSTPSGESGGELLTKLGNRLGGADRSATPVQPIKIVLMSVIAAVLYGIAHDQVTARVCVEYFTIGHPPVFGTDDPTLLGIGLGVIATWWVGLLLGVPLAVVARAGQRPKRSAKSLARAIALLLAVMAASAWVAGVTGWLLARSGAVFLVGPIARELPAERHVPFLADLWAHSASYIVGLIGGAVVLILVWRSRGRAVLVPAAVRADLPAGGVE